MSCFCLNSLKSVIHSFTSYLREVRTDTYHQVSLHKATLWIHHNEEEKHIFITSALFCPRGTTLLINCHCFHLQVCFKEEITPFLYLMAFAYLPHSSFLPKNENTSIKKAVHLFWGSSFSDILLFQRSYQNLRQHF